MRPINFPGCNVLLAKDQPEYNQLPAMKLDEHSQYIVCWELSSEGLEEMNKTKRLYYSQITFGQSFHPMQLSPRLEDVVNTLSIDVVSKAQEFVLWFHRIMADIVSDDFHEAIDNFKDSIRTYYNDLSFEGKDTFKKALPEAIKRILA